MGLTLEFPSSLTCLLALNQQHYSYAPNFSRPPLDTNTFWVLMSLRTQHLMSSAVDTKQCVTHVLCITHAEDPFQKHNFSDLSQAHRVCHPPVQDLAVVHVLQAQTQLHKPVQNGVLRQRTATPFLQQAVQVACGGVGHVCGLSTRASEWCATSKTGWKSHC